MNNSVNIATVSLVVILFSGLIYLSKLHYMSDFVVFSSTIIFCVLMISFISFFFILQSF